jgi:S1-C subfamily serine protease
MPDCAADAGRGRARGKHLRRGDIIVAVNGEYMTTMDELVSYLVVNTRPGDTVNLLIVAMRLLKFRSLCKAALHETALPRQTCG